MAGSPRRRKSSKVQAICAPVDPAPSSTWTPPLNVVRPFHFPGCTAAVNIVNANEIKIDETVECAENELKNVNENIQIDLAKEKNESSTGNSVSAKIDYNPVVIAEPVNTGRTLMNIDSQDQSKINLCQTVSCNCTPLNISLIQVLQ
jgi:hypothetical protein